MVEFKLAFCSHDAAKYSVENWHYSRCLPAGKLVKIGVWEEGKFIGCIIYSSGANPNLAKPYGLQQMEVCELTRIALNRHKNHVSKFLAISLKILKKKSPAMKLIVSYADPEQDHHGGVYQATNWIYLGITKPATHYVTDKGFRIHSKTVHQQGKGYATKLQAAGKITTIKCWKHKYIYPLEKNLWPIFKSKAKKYPVRSLCNSSISGDQPEGDVQVDPNAHSFEGQTDTEQTPDMSACSLLEEVENAEGD